MGKVPQSLRRKPGKRRKNLPYGLWPGGKDCVGQSGCLVQRKHVERRKLSLQAKKEHSLSGFSIKAGRKGGQRSLSVKTSGGAAIFVIGVGGEREEII